MQDIILTLGLGNLVWIIAIITPTNYSSVFEGRSYSRDGIVMYNTKHKTDVAV